MKHWKMHTIIEKNKYYNKSNQINKYSYYNFFKTF